MTTVEERFRGANVIDAGKLSPYWGEHAARYTFAKKYVADAVVLDIACGTGYGIGVLQDAARFIVGADVDLEAAMQSQNECSKNAAVLLADGLKLPFEDASFDVVTSFETLEHLFDRRRFLSELSRVLKPNGFLILSTPNANYTKPIEGKPTNPFHIHEYTPSELRNELELDFSIMEYFGQSLNPRITVSPFYQDQIRMSGDLKTRSKLFGWKVMNKLPFRLRETMSNLIWNAPFYPIESDYDFLSEKITEAPVLVAVCKKK